MLAAITAKRAGADVCILEHGGQLGKKLLATGNGRCNFTNLYQEESCYRCSDPSFPRKILEQFPVSDTVQFFRELGVCEKSRDGYLYPNSDQASSVREVLAMEIERLGIEVHLGVEVCDVRACRKGFEIRAVRREEQKTQTYYADRLILAAGSKASPSTGSDGSGYRLAKQLGHTIVPVLPALVQLCSEEAFFSALAGVRVQGKVSLFVDGELAASDTGEIQLTNYGISGIPVFQVSRYASEGLYRKKKVTAELDFAPDCTEEEFLEFLGARIRRRPMCRMQEFFVGLYNDKLAKVLLRLSKIDKSKRAGELSEREIWILMKLVKSLGTRIAGTKSFEQAQVCAGGVSTRELDGRTLESVLVHGLYFAGEIIDVDGICGGYNLQWAWSSGYAAGRSAAGETSRDIPDKRKGKQ